MENDQTDILDSGIVEHQVRRRKLLPWWIKVFTWIFLVMGAMVPVVFVLGLTGQPIQLAFYGFETLDAASIIGIGLMLVFLLKGITAFGLWTEKDWAIQLGVFDAIIGIAVCIFSMFINPIIDADPGFNITFRLELVVLIPYLFKLRKIKPEWDKARS